MPRAPLAKKERALYGLNHRKKCLKIPRHKHVITPIIPSDTSSYAFCSISATNTFLGNKKINEYHYIIAVSRNKALNLKREIERNKTVPFFRRPI